MRQESSASYDVIGPYRLLEKLGEGGMGEVWVAEQSAPVRRRVALKVIKAGMDTRQVIARFEAERQALALMEHPAIARVFDAGETPRGLPYFAMEYVRGESITTYCDRERLTNEARLRLFVDVCHGVQHAHQKGIIHRDLKPGNVLVTIQDGKPVPKIIDFGLAKAVAQRLTEKTLYTEHGAMIGTPTYMSPEQAEMTGLDVDTRTDIYSLGVILYELLTGVLPFDSRALSSAGYDEIRRWIREVEPPLPSRRVTGAGAVSSESAERRRTVPSRLAGQLHGELDWIVMKTIEKDRTRRYASPSELAADIGRYLVDEPVTARPPSTAYRAKKFVTRHKLGVAVATVAVLGLSAFASTMAIQAGRIAIERDRAAIERDRAQQVAEFLRGLFHAANPVQARSQELTVRELLDVGAARIERDLERHPLVRAELMSTIGNTYRILGQSAEASRMLAPATAALERELGGRHPDTLRLRTDLGIALWGEGKLADAERELRAVLERGVGTDMEHSELMANATHSLGGVLLAQNEVVEAEARYRDALALAEASMGPEHSLTLGILIDLSNVVALESSAEAVPMVRELLPRLRAVVGEEHPLYVVALANLVNNLHASGDVAGAVSIGEDALVRARRVLGDAGEATLNLASILARAYCTLQRYDESRELAISVIETLERARVNPSLLIYTKTVLADVCARRERHAEAELIRAEIVELERRAHGEDAPELGIAMYNLACSLALQGKHAEALAWLRQSVEHGYRNADWMAKDGDFESLHGDAEFEALVAAARAASPR